MEETAPNWEGERHALLSQRISDIGLAIRGTLLEKLVDQLYEELAAKGLDFRPPVYLSDQWGCPDGVPLIGVPFYLADARLSRIEEDYSTTVEGEEESMRYLRHEAGHAFNYAYRLYDRPDWRKIFGPYSRPYRERYRADPFSHDFVRHILGWYAQKHPDEDFAETFAVWLTPGIDWRRGYAGWGALAKLEYVDKVMKEIAHEVPEVPEPSADDLPVTAMQYTLAEHYEDSEERIPIRDQRIFDGDLKTIFADARHAPGALSATEFIARHKREIVTRISYWTGENASVVRQFVDFLDQRVAQLELKLAGLEAATLIELTAFGTAVMMNYRHTNAIDGTEAADDKVKITVLHSKDALDPPVDPILDQLDAALVANGHTSRRLAVDDTVQPLIDELTNEQPDLVFNLAESFRGKSALESNVAALLNLIDLRYTGSSPAGLILAGDKTLTKKVLAFHGILSAKFATMYRGQVDWAGDIQFPLLVKPPQEDASLGITQKSIVNNVKELLDVMGGTQQEYQSPVLVEEFIDGREFYVGVLGNSNVEALPIIELDFSRFPAGLPRIASWEAKWGDDGDEKGAEFEGTESVFPTDLSEEMTTKIQKVAIDSFQALRLRDYARIDLRVTAKDEIYVIEANPNCYLEEKSEFARAAQKGGMEYPALIERIVQLASARSR